MTFFTRGTQVSRVSIFFYHFEFSLNSAELTARPFLSCAHDLPQGVEFGSFLPEIHKLSTKT